MKDEIKEIVDDLIKNRDKLVRGFYFPEDLLGTLDLIKLIDYITNLQEENERLNNIINELEKESHLDMLENQNNNDYAKGLYCAYEYINQKIIKLKEGKE